MSDLTGVINLRVNDQASGVINKLAGGFGQLSSNMGILNQAAGQYLQQTGYGMQRIGGQITGFIRGIQSAAAETESAGNAVRTLFSGAEDGGRAAIATLTKGARKIGLEWAMMPKEVLGSFYDLKSGISSLDEAGLIAMMEGVATTAKATRSSVQDMTSAFSAGFNVMGKNWIKNRDNIEMNADGIKRWASVYSNQLAMAVEQNKTTGTLMQAAMENTGAAIIDKGLMTQGEVIAALGYAQNTKGAKEIGTAFMNLSGDWSKVSGNLNKQFGVDIADAEGRYRKLVDVAKDVVAQTKGMTIVQKDAALAAVGMSKRTIKAWGAIEQGLTDEIFLNQLEAMREMDAESEKYMSQAEKMASAMKEGYEYNAQKMAVEIQVLKEELAQGLGPVFTDMMQGVSGFIGKLREMLSENPQLLEMVSNFLKIGLVAGGLLTTFGKVTSLIGRMSTGISSFMTAFGKIRSGGLSALWGGGRAGGGSSNTATINANVANVNSKTADMGGSRGTGTKGSAWGKGLKIAGMGLLFTALPMLIGMLTGNKELMAALKPAIDAIKLAIGELGAALAPAFKMLTESLTPLLTQVAGFAAELITSLVPPIVGILVPVIKLVSDILKTVVPIVTEVISSLIPPLMEIVDAVVPPLIDIVEMLLPPIMSVVDALLPPILMIIQTVKPVVDTIMAAISPVIGIIGDVLSTLLPIIIKAMTWSLPIASKLLEVIAWAVKELFYNMPDWLGTEEMEQSKYSMMAQDENLSPETRRIASEKSAILAMRELNPELFGKGGKFELKFGSGSGIDDAHVLEQNIANLRNSDIDPALLQSAITELGTLTRGALGGELSEAKAFIRDNVAETDVNQAHWQNAANAEFFATQYSKDNYEASDENILATINQKYGRNYQSLEGAKKALAIDDFFTGGTLGADISKEIDEMKANNDFGGALTELYSMGKENSIAAGQKMFNVNQENHYHVSGNLDEKVVPIIADQGKESINQVVQAEIAAQATPAGGV